ncbi:hypothetical protein F4818DRAFT_86917 [Hypoxylon cercidicola]|nr:hypothetical protein F4818DRAFT_86917 [Hypoxylon cercidicola]
MAPKILFVLTSYGEILGPDGKPIRRTGWYLPEFAHPYDVLAPKSEIAIASAMDPGRLVVRHLLQHQEGAVGEHGQGNRLPRPRRRVRRHILPWRTCPDVRPRHRQGLDRTDQLVLGQGQGDGRGVPRPRCLYGRGAPQRREHHEGQGRGLI